MTFKVIDERNINGRIEVLNLKTMKRIFIKLNKAVKNGEIVRL